MVAKTNDTPVTVTSLRSLNSFSEVSEWSTNDVGDWLTSIGFLEYAELFSLEHKIDGSTLLLLRESDLKEAPLQMKCLGHIKRLSKSIDELRKKQSSSASSPGLSESNDDMLVRVDYNKRRKMSISGEDLFVTTKQSAIISEDELLDTLSSSGDIQSVRLITRDELIRTVESPDTPIKSLAKLMIAFLYCQFSLLITAFVMVLVHDRVPDMKTYPPLPDIVLDNLPLIPWAFDMCEMIGVALSCICLLVLIFHKHRVIIMRRMFSLVGTVFLLRCITMLITSLSVPGVHLECRAKSYGSLKDKLIQAFHIWSKLGMSIQGVRTCGDYMFSGHTTAITLLNHFVTEYTPPSWTSLHTSTWVLNLFGIFFILAGHEHYSIDVFIAFYISSRMFLYYHAYAYNHANLTATDDRIRLWFPLGWFFEAGSIGKVEPFAMEVTQNQTNGLSVIIPLGGKSESHSPNERRSGRARKNCNPHAREWPPATATVAPQEKRPRMSTVQPTSSPVPTISAASLNRDHLPTIPSFKKEIKPQREVKVFKQPSMPPPPAAAKETTPDPVKNKMETNLVTSNIVKFVYSEWKDAQFTPKELSQGGSRFIRGLKMKEIEAALLLLSQQGLLSRRLKCERGEKCTHIYTPMDFEKLHPFDQKHFREGYGLEI